jgi:hypothetical protein
MNCPLEQFNVEVMFTEIMSYWSSQMNTLGQVWWNVQGNLHLGLAQTPESSRTRELAELWALILDPEFFFCPSR